MASFGFRNANNQTYYIAQPVDENGNPTADLRDIICRNDDLWNQWINAPSANPKKQITLTVYDVPYTSIAINAPGSLYQQNLRNRVSYSMVFNAATQMQTLADGTVSGGNSATYYTYDIHGNVDTLVQDYNTGMGTIAGNRFKKMVYSYDLISGKVNYVAYQPNAADAFYHRYGYDAENKLTKVETSKDAVYWETDATYDYYRHGPLAKTITGELQVQSVTNAYTIQGWIKGVVPGNDANTLIASQAFNYGIGYFANDYQPISNTVAPFASVYIPTNGGLYNGNIAAMKVDIPKLGTAMLHTYNYDQLNRIKAVSNYNNYNATANSWTATQANNETLNFDPNGNIKTATLNGAATSLPYENFTYTYDAVKQNRLLSITNTIGSTVTTSNYDYDAIGNMTKDELEGNLNMQWSVYGKLLHAEKANGKQINYTYDANNTCISKAITSGGSTATTYYVRDASGNIMVTYQKDAAINSGKLSTTAYQLYGSSNMGAWKKLVDVESSYTIPTTYTFTRGEHEYYFSNHLGNNLLVLSDKKLQISTNTTTIDHYEADVLNATDYSAYGENLIGREFNGSSITYGFNGKINNPETGYQDYGFRDYSARRRGFTRIDPLTGKYPELTPYQFASNTPLQAIDMDGLEGMMSPRSKIVEQLWTRFKTWLNESSQLSTDITNAHLVTLGIPSKMQRATNADVILFSIADGMHHYGMYMQHSSVYVPKGSTSTVEPIVEPTVPVRRNVSQPQSVEEAPIESTSLPNGLKPLVVSKYSESKKVNAKTGFSGDHIPSYKALVAIKEKALGRPLTNVELAATKNEGLVLTIKTKLHISNSETYAGRNQPTKIAQDATDPIKAISNNVNAYRGELLKEGYTNSEIDNVIKLLSAPFQKSPPVKTP